MQTRLVGTLIGIGRLDIDDPYTKTGAFGEAVVRTETGDVRVVGLSVDQCRAMAPSMYKTTSITIVSEDA